jgi:hypothetical protein
MICRNAKINKIFKEYFSKNSKIREDSRLFKNVVFSTWIFQNQATIQ